MSIEDSLLTEAGNPASEQIDSFSPLQIVELMNAEDHRVVEAVATEAPVIARVIELVADRFERGGRLIYVGAGTSGRLGVLDASECPPTFSTPPSMVVGLIAGGTDALTRAIEGAEDSHEQGAVDLSVMHPTAVDVVVGIASSGRTPYVIGALDHARSVRASTVALVCNRPSLLDDHAELVIAPLVGPEVVTGSTRLKAGTATKMVLNMITTGAMVRIGKTYGNRMIDLQPTNEKLRLRTKRILRELTGVSDSDAASLLNATSGRLKPALVAAGAGIDIPWAEQLLAENHGQVRAAIHAATGVDPR